MPHLRSGVEVADDHVLLCGCGSADVDVVAGDELEVALGGLREGAGMCVTCGCGRPVEVHPHTPRSRAAPLDLLAIEERVLANNDHLAAHNRAWLERRGIRAVNLMSSPGSGKTSLLERTIAETSAPTARSA